MRSNTQKSVTLSVTEAEQAAAVGCAQDMLFVMRLLESIGLKVKKPMVLKLANKGAQGRHNQKYRTTIHRSYPGSESTMYRTSWRSSQSKIR